MDIFLTFDKKKEIFDNSYKKTKTLIQKVLSYLKNAYGVLHSIQLRNLESKLNFRFMIYLFRDRYQLMEGVIIVAS